jgi:hypothetical protein
MLLSVILDIEKNSSSAHYDVGIKVIIFNTFFENIYTKNNSGYRISFAHDEITRIIYLGNAC